MAGDGGAGDQSTAVRRGAVALENGQLTPLVLACQTPRSCWVCPSTNVGWSWRGLARTAKSAQFEQRNFAVL
jgi:hypothetical protein